MHCPKMTQLADRDLVYKLLSPEPGLVMKCATKHLSNLIWDVISEPDPAQSLP